jgi:hypothetical protein
MSLKNLLNQRFKRLLVIKRAENNKDGGARWICRCDCGNIINTAAHTLLKGHSGSCGCLRRDNIVAAVKRHGLYLSREYQCWQNMIARCYRPRHESYCRYGARGIRVCHRWRKSFLSFYLDMGPRPAGMYGKYAAYSIERKNNDLGYSPDNCVWATRLDQMKTCRKPGRKQKPS